MVKELLSQDDPLLYGEAASVIITRLLKPSNTHFIPVATLAEILEPLGLSPETLALEGRYAEDTY